jgi:hypothetical protein
MRWPEADSRLRRVVLAVALYAACVAIYFAVAPRSRLLEHSPFNHFALLATSWLEGRLDLGQTPPLYAQNNDFANVGDRWYVAFPPFPAMLLLPVAFVAGSAEDIRDAQVFIWLAGIAPAVTFLALEKLRRSGRSDRSERENVTLALLFAFGTVYFFTAVQGTVWFAAHVVGAGVAALYLLFALDAERPVLAGLMIACGFMTRTPLLFAVPLFAFEMVRVSLRDRADPLPDGVGRVACLRRFWERLDVRRVLRLGVLFSLPILAGLAFTFWHNQARFGSPLDFGYEYLTVAWASRMKKWGLFSYHYLSRNLSVVLAGLPWLKHGGQPFQINAHGLALWFTTPLYAYALWPRRTSPLQRALALTALAVAVPTLIYQNTGWVQFGYRFSNDYAVFLVALVAVSGRPMRTIFGALALWSVVVNAFGAVTFDRAEYRRFYFQDASQKVFFQPD